MTQPPQVPQPPTSLPSTSLPSTAPPPTPGASNPAPSNPAPTRPAPSTGRPTWWGIRTVALLESRQRLRSTRWKIALGVWAAIVGLVTLGVVTTIDAMGGSDSAAGRISFGLVLLFVLLLGLLVSPTLSSTSINGDRTTGTLAVLQATTLSAWDIVLGKLAAAWLSALAFLAASVPFLVWAFALGGTSVVGAVGGVLAVAFVLLVVCAIALAMSALVARTSGSAVLTYLVVAGLSIGTPIAFALTSSFMTSGYETVRVYGYETYDRDVCTWYETERWVTHTERTAWMLVPNPFTIVADVAAAGGPTTEVGMTEDPMSLMSFGVRAALVGGARDVDECWGERGSRIATTYPAPYWPWGMGIYALLGAGSVWFTVRRLAIPARTLPKGTRIA